MAGGTVWDEARRPHGCPARWVHCRRSGCRLHRARPDPQAPPLRFTAHGTRRRSGTAHATPEALAMALTIPPALARTSTPSTSCALSSAISAGTLTCAARHTHRGCPDAARCACAAAWVSGSCLSGAPGRRGGVSTSAVSFGKKYVGDVRAFLGTRRGGRRADRRAV